ncbi:MAG: RNA-binding protein [Anaerolineaceae bacterium]|nr:RNA-binding protein [Anaerolineaceae bacterium]
MEDLVGYIAKSLVNDPSQVKVRRRVTNSAVILELQVAPEDVGRVIGKDGRVANAIRALLRVADHSRQNRKRIILEIL